LAERLDGLAVDGGGVDAISEKFRRIMGHADLWMLKAALDEKDKNRCLADQPKAGQRGFKLEPPPALSTVAGTSSSTNQVHQRKRSEFRHDRSDYQAIARAITSRR
jgi:hypothetical protein